MARIFKFSGYMVDPGGDLTDERLRVSLEEGYDAIARHIQIEERDLGEWDDDNPLNLCDCPVSECEKYFDEISVADMRQRLTGMCNGRECDPNCSLFFMSHSCNFMPMDDAEIRDAYKVAFNK